MSEKPIETLNPRSPETPKESSTLDIFSNGFDTIIKSYSEVTTPPSEEAKKLFKNQYTELHKKFELYKTTPVGKQLMIESRSNTLTDTKIKIMDDTFRDIATLVEGTDEKNILMGISRLREASNNKDINANITKVIFTLLPREYAIDGVITRDTNNNINIDEESGKFEGKMRAFLDGKAKTVPHFNLNTFKEHPKLIREFLSRSGSVIGIYEDYHTEMLAKKSPEFTKMIQDILIKEYPDFFGIAKNKKWYNSTTPSFGQISTFLDIIQYYKPERRAIFIDMMDKAEGGESSASSDLYERYFSGEEIGTQIIGYFKQTNIIDAILKERLKTIEKHTDSGSIDTILHEKTGVRDLAGRIYMDIPKKDLEILLKSLPNIEKSAAINRPDGILASLKEMTDIDLRYKSLFMHALTGISCQGNVEDVKRSQIYAEIAKNFDERLNVFYEQLDIENQATVSGSKISDIIRSGFPNAKNSTDGKDRQERKQKDFDNFLKNKDIFSEKGAIKIEKKNLIERLRKIFDSPEGIEIMNKIEESEDGKAIFELLANSFSEQKTHQEKTLTDKGFDTKKWEKLQKENIIDSEVIFEKLADPKTSQAEKIKILKEYFLEGKTVPTDPEELKLLINEIVALRSTEKITERLSNQENFIDFSKAWKSGDFTEFNQKSQEREQKREQEEIIKQQEQKLGTKEKDKIDTVVPFNIDKKFTEIPVGQPMISGSGNDTVFIHRNSDNTMSIYSPSGKMSIDGIRIINQEKPFEDIEKAMDSIQFLKESGLDIFRNDLPKIIDAINHRASKGAGNSIDITDGISTDEGFILLETIGKITQEKVEIKTRDDSQLNALKRQFSMEGGGFLSKLQNTGYAKSDQIDIKKITDYITTQG